MTLAAILCFLRVGSSLKKHRTPCWLSVLHCSLQAVLGPSPPSHGFLGFSEEHSASLSGLIDSFPSYFQIMWLLPEFEHYFFYKGLIWDVSTKSHQIFLNALILKLVSHMGRHTQWSWFSLAAVWKCSWMAPPEAERTGHYDLCCRDWMGAAQWFLRASHGYLCRVHQINDFIRTGAPQTTQACGGRSRLFWQMHNFMLSHRSCPPFTSENQNPHYLMTPPHGVLTTQLLFLREEWMFPTPWVFLENIPKFGEVSNFTHYAFVLWQKSQSNSRILPTVNPWSFPWIGGSESNFVQKIFIWKHLFLL